MPSIDAEQRARIAQAVEQQLSAFGSGIREPVAELAARVAADEHGLGLVVLQLRGRTLSLVGRPGIGFWLHFQTLVERVAARLSLPDLRFVVNANDAPRVVPAAGPIEGDWIAWPSGPDYLRFSGERGAEAAREHPSVHAPLKWPLIRCAVPIFSIAVIPGLHMDLTYPGQHTCVAPTNAAKDAMRWNDKASAVYWRGSTTGGLMTMENWHRFPRVRWAMEARGAEGADVALTGVGNCNSGERRALTALLREHGLLAETDPVERELGFKHLLDIDGNISAFRLPRAFWSRAAVWRTPGFFHEFYHRWLEPGVHYLAVAEGELQSRITWARAHDQRVELIAAAGRAFAERTFNWTFAEAYMERLLTGYAALY